ncbi:ErmE/ErmH/ErmO/ErmR family 23S rRNA (adenine(2058)-N(6))-methyltransferase [Solwaraspora sp. WMMD791]|uniref:ErmE/ErmH/ErmO/ErmR family 23S rRNA (adenine(2058)-N(6))-methyltransferase n=1 Tax=Solwaraspora sp. WMMD791 TaxID=3016086 RepID=UPI002499AE76|nr:ErmE/ErmH/ErmO/ErmR family 23S rRNA (adenine(2058)-N(6))-methyltransferase [Solwaraspora sp. WMMD791]WFE27012.1 ErmE/ErmH/ErmO/ErmR family 23S rRNA (adenine(2058)-N(6))-methyltransferase [Solwaraspora sp. WMMD791]
MTRPARDDHAARAVSAADAVPAARRGAADRTRRAYSQTNLSDRLAIDRVVRAARVTGSLTVEVGAGTGQLTGPLARSRARAGGRLLAYEVDPALAGRLARRCAALPNVTVLAADFLAAAPPAEPFDVVGNIPYAATAPIVAWCLRAPALQAATLVTQLEYARKRTGDFGRWSRLTVRTWPVFDWRLAGRITRTAFRPVPVVDGGILRLTRRPVPLVPAAALPAYQQLVDLGFSGVGGSVAASLRRRFPQRRVSAALRANRIDADALAGQLWPEQWIALFRLLQA